MLIVGQEISRAHWGDGVILRSKSKTSCFVSLRSILAAGCILLLPVLLTARAEDLPPPAGSSRPIAAGERLVYA